MPRTLCEDVETTPEGLRLTFHVRIRGNQFACRVTAPWKWIASTDAIDHIEKELARRNKHRERAGRPWLPLEAWE